ARLPCSSHYRFHGTGPELFAIQELSRWFVGTRQSTGYNSLRHSPFSYRRQRRTTRSRPAESQQVAHRLSLSGCPFRELPADRGQRRVGRLCRCPVAAKRDKVLQAHRKLERIIRGVELGLAENHAGWYVPVIQHPEALVGLRLLYRIELQERAVCRELRQD